MQGMAVRNCVSCTRCTGQGFGVRCLFIFIMLDVHVAGLSVWYNQKGHWAGLVAFALSVILATASLHIFGVQTHMPGEFTMRRPSWSGMIGSLPSAKASACSQTPPTVAAAAQTGGRWRAMQDSEPLQPSRILGSRWRRMFFLRGQYSYNMS